MTTPRLHPLYPKTLRYVAAVAELGSVQAASREVSISASAIDRLILLIEEELGVPLFERLSRGMKLTAAGVLLLNMSQRWNEDLNRTLSEIMHLQGMDHGQLKLVAMDSHTNGFLAGYLQAASEEYRGVALDVEIVSPDEAAARLRQGEADLAVAYNLKPQSDLLELWKTELPLGCAVANHHPLGAQAGASLREVAQWPLVVQSRALSIRRYLERRHRALFENAVAPLTTGSLQLIKNLVCQGSHVALTSELDMGPEIMAGKIRFLPLLESNVQPQTISVAVGAHRPLQRVARVLAELLVQHVQSHLAQVRAAQPGPGAPTKTLAVFQNVIGDMHQL